jgi:hypothetical protein
MALGHITEIRVYPKGDKVRVTVRRKSDIGTMTGTFTSSEYKEAFETIEAQMEKREVEVKLFRQRYYPHLVTWEPLPEPKG